MNLTNFESQIEQKILARGQGYCEQGKVRRLEKVGADEFSAVVYGTERYNIFIKLSGENIEEWECDCPYDWGDVCKHAVAVIYQIRDGGFQKGKPVVQDDLQTALTNIAEEELREFVVDYLKRDWQFRKAFLTKFVEGFEPDEEDEFWDEY